MGIELTIGDVYQSPKPVIQRRVSTRNLMEETWQVRLYGGPHEAFFKPAPKAAFLGWHLKDDISEWLRENDPLHYEWSIHEGTAIEFSCDATALAFRMRWL